MVLNVEGKPPPVSATTVGVVGLGSFPSGLPSPSVSASSGLVDMVTSSLLSTPSPSGSPVGQAKSSAFGEQGLFSSVTPVGPSVVEGSSTPVVSSQLVKPSPSVSVGSAVAVKPKPVTSNPPHKAPPPC